MTMFGSVVSASRTESGVVVQVPLKERGVCVNRLDMLKGRRKALKPSSRCRRMIVTRSRVMDTSPCTRVAAHRSTSFLMAWNLVANS